MEDGLYGVVAVRTDAEGENDIESKGKILFFTTADFLQYDEIGLIDLHTDNYVQDVACVYDPAAKSTWYTGAMNSRGGTGTKPPTCSP